MKHLLLKNDKEELIQTISDGINIPTVLLIKSDNSLYFWGQRNAQFNYNISQELYDALQTEEGKSYYGMYGIPNDMLELSSNGYIYSSFIVNGEEKATPLSNIITTPFGPITGETRLIEEEHNAVNTLPYYPDSDIIGTFTKPLKTNNPLILLVMKNEGMSIPVAELTYDELNAILGDLLTLTNDGIIINKNFASTVLLAIGGDSSMENVLSFSLLFLDEETLDENFILPEYITPEGLNSFLQPYAFPLLVSYTSSEDDYSCIQFSNKDINFVHNFSITFERPLVDDDYILVGGQILKISSDLLTSMFRTDDRQTVYPTLSFVEMAIIMNKSDRLNIYDINGNIIKYQLHYRTGGVPRYVYHPIQAGKINVVAELSPVLYKEHINNCVVGALWEFWVENDYCGYVTSPLLPYRWTNTGSGGHMSGIISLGLEEVIFPEGITFIPGCFAEHQSTLKTVTLPSSTKKILDYAFNGCSELENVNLNESLESIGMRSFSGCKNLTSIILPQSLESIGNDAFYHCDNLTSIILPQSLESIGSYAFSNCVNLTEIQSNAFEAPSIGNFPFSGIANNGVLRVPMGSDYSSWLGALPSGWVIEYLYKPTVCTNLTIKAEDVNGKQTKTLITYTATTNGYNPATNEPMKDIIISGVTTSDAFEQNTSHTDTIEREITFEFMGVTASTTITQGVWVDKYYSINLNNQWRKSDTMSNPDSELYDGIYESFSNFNIHNSTATCTITIDGYTEFKLYVRSVAEKYNDYVIVYNLDSTTVEKYTTQGKQQDKYTSVKFSNIDGGEHTITIVYRKDSTTNSGDDRGYFLIPFEQ